MKSVNFFKKAATALVIVAVAFAGCGEDPAELEQPGIVIDPEVALERTADASAVSAGSVKFTTSAEWSSAIAPDTVTWLSIDPAAGAEAGTYTVNFVLKPNTAEDNRTATVTVTAGGMSAKINVTQRGTAAVTETPEERTITFRVYGCEEQWSPYNGKEEYFLLEGVTVNIYRGTELVASPKTSAEGIAEAVLMDGVYSYVAVNDSVVPWSNLYSNNPESTAGRIIVGIYPESLPSSITERDRALPGMLRCRDIDGDGYSDRGGDYVPQVELPVTKDATVDVYVAPRDFNPVYARSYRDRRSIYEMYDYISLIRYAYLLDVSLTFESAEYITIEDYSEIDVAGTAPYSGSLWDYAYNMIMKANTVLELMPAVYGPDTSEPEMHYYRAYLYYTLLNYFGGVPITSTIRNIDYMEDKVTEARSSETEVEEQIIADCDFAAANYGDVWGQFGNFHAALQLKARVLMRRGEHSAAVAVLQEIISSGKFSLSTGWGGGNEVVPGLDFVSLPQELEKGDGVYRGWAYPMRYAETLLLYAEASLATGNVAAAAGVANQFAEVAYLSPVFPDAGSATQEAVNTEITRLWNTQLNMEGHTFARLKRTGAFPGALAAYGAQEHHRVMPIPAAEIARNPNLVQNEGY